MKVLVFDKETGEKSPEMEFAEFVTSNAKEIEPWRYLHVCYHERYELRPVLEGVEIVFGRKLNGELGLFSEIPILKQHSIQPIKPHGYYIEMASNLLPSIQPGQCVKAKIVLEEE